MRRRTPFSLLLGLLFFPLVTHCQTPEATLPVGTPLPVRIDDHLPMRAGVPVRAELIYPVYVDNRLILPAKTILNGTVTDLRSDHSRRVRARINGDFTPFHIPVVRFTQITLVDGTTLPLTTGTATDGAPIFRLVAPPPRKGGFIRQQWDAGMQILHDQIAVFTAPEKGDRLLQLFYHQLPYHPERIEKETAWTVETTEPVVIPAQPATASAGGPVDPATPAPVAVAPTPDSGPPTWTIQGYLGEALNSATAKTGQQVKATVAEPIYNADHTIAVPQGATLVGAVTQAKPARSFGRAGVLRFDFRQIVLPSGQSQTVQAQLTGADSASADKLAMNSEGQVKPKPQDKIVVPLILAFLASRPLDEDRGASTGGKNFVGANGFGLAGNLISLAGGSAKVAAGIGFYGTAVALYYRWIAPGRQVSFARDTRIVLQTTARRAAALKPAAQ